VFAAAWRKLERRTEARIERGIHTGDILANDGFQPAFGLRAVKGWRYDGERLAMQFKVVQETVQSGA